ncbi:MAG: hypothetical protein ACPGVT_01455 [Maricaulaceae bacterium]
MKTYLKLCFAGACILGSNVTAFADDCELIVMNPAKSDSQEAILAAAEYHSAEAFLKSVYDADKDTIMTVEEKPIRAVMCTRENVVPTLRDLPLIQTGLPLSLSQDFNATDSSLLTLYDDGKDYKADYSGPALSKPDEKNLIEMLEVFQLQRLAK